MRDSVVRLSDVMYERIKLQAEYNKTTVARQIVQLCHQALDKKYMEYRQEYGPGLDVRIMRLITRDEAKGITARRLVSGISGATYPLVHGTLTRLLEEGKIEVQNTGRTVLYRPRYEPMVTRRSSEKRGD